MHDDKLAFRIRQAYRAEQQLRDDGHHYLANAVGDLRRTAVQMSKNNKTLFAELAARRRAA
jgi:hypothetical protein